MIIRVIIDDYWHQRLFYQTSWKTVTASDICLARNTELADVYTDGANF